MGGAVRVREAPPQHHVAAAFAVDGSGGREGPQAGQERGRGGDPAAVQFGVAARQPAGVAIVGGRLVGERGKEAAFRPGPAPARQHVWVQERESRVARDRDPPSGRRNQRARASRVRSGPPEGPNGREVHVRLDEVGQKIKPRRQVVGFAGLHEAEVPLGQGDRGTAGQGAQHRQAEGRDRVGHQPAVPLAADAVQHHARDPDSGVEVQAALDLRGRGLRLAADVVHQQDGPAQGRRHVGAGTAPPFRSGHAVEEPHQSLADHEVACRAVVGREAYERGRFHGPGVQVEAGPSGRGGVKRGIDVVRAAFGTGHVQAAPGEGAEQAQGQRGLAATRAGRRHDEAGRGHAPAPPLSAAGASTSCNRTMSPIATMAGAPRPRASASALARPSAVTWTP